MSAESYWPCPNGCMSWVRCFDPSKPMTNHHPNCEHVDKSLIDVWRVSIPGEETGCICDNEADARRMATEDEEAQLDVTPMKMHREVYENLGEFGGF